MLKNIDPLLNTELLGVLQAMGHGDEIVVVDRNYPADSTAAHTIFGRVIHMSGVDCSRVTRAILSVMPLDSYVDAPASRMAVIDATDEIPAVQAEVQVEIDNAEGKQCPMQAIERMQFYEFTKSAYAIVMTGESRPYGCFSFKKGVIFSE